MNKIDTLIAYLFAIQAFAKDIHYSASGEAFYSKHLLADEIHKGIDEQIDALIETCVLPFGKPKRITEYYTEVEKILYEPFENDDNTNFENLRNLIQKTLKEIASLQNVLMFSKGDLALTDSIAQDLQRKLGLITRQVG